MSVKFKNRSGKEELLDSPDVPLKLLFQNLRELDFLNRKTGGHAVSLEGLKLLLKDKNREYCIADLGCGSGDWLRYTAVWARDNGYKVELTGVDKNQDAIRYLNRNSSRFPEIRGFAGDYRDFINRSPVDIFHCALFCHHLDDREIVELFGLMTKVASVGFVINDLKRSRLAYYGVKMFTTLLNGSSLSKHDGPVSVLRGFKKKELERMLKQADVTQYLILRRTLFRYLIVGKGACEADFQII